MIFADILDNRKDEAAEAWEAYKMKKINVVFIGECIIIVLLLVILGVLLKDGGAGISKDRLSMEEKAAEEYEAAGDTMAEAADAEMVNVTEVMSIPSDPASSVSDNAVEEKKSMSGRKIVVFGDSIWSEARGADGICEYIQDITGAEVYNCAIGGTTAALVGEDAPVQEWTSDSFNGMIYAIRGLTPMEQIITDGEVLEIAKQVDFNEMDYVIVSYGLNDFFSDVSIYPERYYQVTNYVGALRNGIHKLQEHYPHLKIILVSPTYTKLFEGEKTFEIGNYVEVARGVAEDMGVQFLDMFHILGNSPETRSEHLGDGVHLSAEGRKVYSAAVIHLLEEMEQQEEN